MSGRKRYQLRWSIFKDFIQDNWLVGESERFNVMLRDFRERDTQFSAKNNGDIRRYIGIPWCTILDLANSIVCPLTCVTSFHSSSSHRQNFIVSTYRRLRLLYAIKGDFFKFIFGNKTI